MPDIRFLVRFGSLVLGGLALTACIVSRHPAGIAPATAPLSATYTVLGPVEDSSCAYRVLFIPVSGKEPTEEIIARLLKERGGDALAGVTVEHRGATFALPLVGSDCTIVKGLAVKNVR